MKKAFINAKIYNTADECFADGALVVEDGVIVSVGDAADADEVIDCGGAYMMPGLVDIHTHGRGGIESTEVDREGCIDMAKAYAKAGTTSFMSTLMSAPYETLLAGIDAAVEAKAMQDNAKGGEYLGANILGIHLEGRYISEIRKGAHDPRYLAPLDADELTALVERSREGGHFKRFLVICAPELDGGEAFIKRAASIGATVTIGHSDASYDQCMAALEWGAVSFTHLFNAMSPLTHRAPGCVGAALSSDCFVELIGDGRHVLPPVVRIVKQAKAKDKLALITDSVPPAGLPDGEYIVGGTITVCRDGAVYLPNGVLNGSIISMHDALLNFAKFNEISIEEAIPYATINPARLVGADDEVGSLEVGKRADFLLLAEDKASIRSVYVCGCEVR